MMNTLLRSKHDEQEESHWLSVSDLMAGLMMVFLFIAIALMRNANDEREKVKEVAEAYKENKESIYKELQKEFGNNLALWRAEIDPEKLAFTFKSEDVLFKSNSHSLRTQYKEYLDDFFPRYMRVLDEFKHLIDEVRIEGYTSSPYASLGEDEAYFQNMWLSQGRTRSVLNYVYLLPEVVGHKPWMKNHIAAVGLSSSKLIYKENGTEDYKASRRVSFRVITNADAQIKRILKDVQ